MLAEVRVLQPGQHEGGLRKQTAEKQEEGKSGGGRVPGKGVINM